MRPTPPPGSSSLDPVHNFTGFKKSTGFCVGQQERRCCIVPRQRLSIRSGPGQPVDRGFSGCRVWGKTCFPPERSSENRFLPRGTWPYPTLHAEILYKQPAKNHREMGVQGNHSPAHRRPSFRCLGAKSPKASPYSQSASGSQANSPIPDISGNKHRTRKTTRPVFI